MADTPSRWLAVSQCWAIIACPSPQRMSKLKQLKNKREGIWYGKVPKYHGIAIWNQHCTIVQPEGQRFGPLHIGHCLNRCMSLFPQTPLPAAQLKQVLPHGVATPASGPWTDRTLPSPHTLWLLTGGCPHPAPQAQWTKRATATVSVPLRTQVTDIHFS